MFEGKHIQVGAGRYIQCHGALKRAGEEMVFFGKKAYLLYGDDVVKGKTSQVLEESLRESGITFQSEIFEGPSTEKSFGEVAARVRESGAEIVAGIGGGRIIDIAKAAGDMADASIFTIPTSAATCAAYAVLYVVYGEDGNVDHSGFLNHEISGVIVDMDLVVNDCPRRYFVSGIVDAMAKKPEFSFTMAHLKDEGMIATSEIATKIADFTYSKYMRDTRQALKDFDDGKDSMLIDDMVNMNIMPVSYTHLPEGDRINLKSKLSQYLSIANMCSNGYIKELELVVHEKEDMDRLIEFMLSGENLK